jgi:hypothetical protein
MSELKLISTEFQCRVRNEFTSRSLLAATVLFIDHTHVLCIWTCINLAIHLPILARWQFLVTSERIDIGWKLWSKRKRSNNSFYVFEISSIVVRIFEDNNFQCRLPVLYAQKRTWICLFVFYPPGVSKQHTTNDDGTPIASIQHKRSALHINI